MIAVEEWDKRERRRELPYPPHTAHNTEDPTARAADVTWKRHPHFKVLYYCY
jgi:hypothetical protein